MAEAAAVVGLVSSIASLIDLGAKVVSRLHEFASKSSDVPESFRSLSVRLPLLTDTLKQIAARAENVHSPGHVTQALQAVVDSTSTQVSIGQAYLAKILPLKDATMINRAVKALKSLAKEDKVCQAVDTIQKNIGFLMLYQTTQHADTGDFILKELSKLTLAPQAVSYAHGVNLGQVPQIDAEVFKAVEQRNKDRVKTLLDDGADVNSRDRMGWPLIHRAICKHDEDTVQLLLDSGANPALLSTANSNHAAIYWAAHEGLTRTVQTLLDRSDAAFCGPPEVYTSAFLQAAKRNHCRVVELLLQSRKVDVNSTGDWPGATALWQAAYGGSIDVVRILLENGAQTEIPYEGDEGETPLYEAVVQGHLDVVRVLGEVGGANPNVKNAHGHTPLTRAVSDANVELVKVLLEIGADANLPSANGCCPLYRAAYEGDLRCVSLLLSQGANPNAQDEDYETPLIAAINGNHEMVVRKLIEQQNIDLDLQNRAQKSALWRAVDKGNASIVRLLLSHEAYANLSSKSKAELLHHALSTKNVAVARILIREGADLAQQDDSGRTALSTAAEQGMVPMVRLLLEKGSEIDAPDYQGNSPLALAVRTRQIVVVELLLEKGADVHAENHLAQTAMTLAEDSDFEEVVLLLQDWGKKKNLGSPTPLQEVVGLT